MSSQRAAQLVEAAIRLQQAGDHERAHRMFEEALMLDPSNARASQGLAREAGGPQTSTLIQYLEPESPPAPAVVMGVGPDAVVAPPLVSDARSAWESKSNPSLDITATTPPPVPRDALDLLSDAPPRATPPPMRRTTDVREELETLIRGARDLLELDDHSGAMDLIQKAAVLAPEDPVVQKLKEKSEVVLQSMYESKLGRLDTRPRVVLRPDEIIWLNLDHRAGFVLAQIDGHVTYEDLFSICGMSRLDTARILAQLVQEGIIAGR